MILGKKKDYNDFEELILDSVGRFEQGYGLEFFYEHINFTFETAEKAILQQTNQYNAEFEKEDFEVRQSIFFSDPMHKLNSIPLTETLHKSHLITMHSELEKTWREIIELYNQFFPRRESGKINEEFLKKGDANCLLDKVLIKHSILLSYNFVRNKIVHQECKTTSLEFSKLKSFVDTGEMPYLRIEINGDAARLTIENIKFNFQYGNSITSFISDIAETSYRERHPLNSH